MNGRPTDEREYDFVLVLTGVEELTPDVEDAFFEAGCDDATLSIRGGHLSLDFSRVASSLKDAILSAIRDVRKAGVGVEVCRVGDTIRTSDRESGEVVATVNAVLEGMRQRKRNPGLVDEVTRAVAG